MAMAVLLAAAVVLRPLRESEIASLARALVETSEAQIENRWREQALGYRELLVAELDPSTGSGRSGELVGTVSISESEGPWRQPGGQAGSVHLFALEVAPALRDRGVGGAIVSGVLEEARRRGRRRVFLEVRVDNPARRLYHRLGFRRVGPAFVNAWWRFLADGTRERAEEAFRGAIAADASYATARCTPARSMPCPSAPRSCFTASCRCPMISGCSRPTHSR